MKIIRKRGDTSNILQVFVQDSSSTTGAGLTGLVFNTSSLTAYYHKDTDTTATAITLVTMTVGTFTSSGFKEIDATNMPGWYQFCPPDAALSTSGTPHSVGFHLKGATNMAPLALEVQLIAADVEDTVRLGLTALPNVASGSAGAIPTTGTGSNQISVTSGQVILQTGTGTGQLSFTSGILKVDVDTIKTNPVVNGGTVTFPTTATLASTTNITAGTMTTTTNVTTVNGLAANVITATSINADAITAAKIADNAIDRATLAVDTGLQSIRSNTAAAGASTSITLDASASSVDSFYKGDRIVITGGTGVGQARVCTAYVGSTQVATISPAWATTPDNTSTFAVFSAASDMVALTGTAQTARDIGASVLLSTGSGTGQLDFTSGVVKANATQWLGGTIPAVNVTGVPLVDLKYTLGTISPATAGSVRADAVTGAVGSVTGLTASNVGAIKTVTDQFAFTVTNQVDANVLDWKSATAPAMTGDAFARLGAPAGASISADVAAVKVDTAAVKVQTDKFAFTVTNQVDANVLDWKSATAPAMTGDAFARLGAPAGASVSADVAAVKVDTAAVKAKTDNLPAAPAAVGDIPTANTNADALLDRANGVEAGLTPRKALRLTAAVIGAKLSGAGTGTEVFRDAVVDSKDRVTATVDSSGNRTAITYDLT